MVYHYLLRDGFVQVPGHFRILGNPLNDDVLDILTNNEELLVGIIGMGDYDDTGLEPLSGLINELVLKGCSIIICACTNKASIVKSIQKFNPIIVVKTTSSNNSQFRIINHLDAESIIALM